MYTALAETGFTVELLNTSVLLCCEHYINWKVKRALIYYNHMNTVRQKNGSALYIGGQGPLTIIDVLGYDG